MDENRIVGAAVEVVANTEEVEIERVYDLGPRRNDNWDALLVTAEEPARVTVMGPVLCQRR
jgi:hypothetical protein